MRIVFITRIVKDRVKRMITDLLPEVGYISINNSGLVTMKRRWWSLSKVNTTVTDLLVGVIPEKIAEYAVASKGIGYTRVFNQQIYTLLAGRGFNPNFDICDYVWKEYTAHCVNMPDFVVATNTERIIVEKKNYLPISIPTPSGMLRSLTDLISDDPKGWFERRFANKVRRMRENLPAPIVRLKVFAFN